MRAYEFLEEPFQGLDLEMEFDDDEIWVTARDRSGRELGHVVFVDTGDELVPQDLEVEERFRGQGIARVMYDWVKSKGYRIRRSNQQTRAGAEFWNRNRPGENVWEQGVAEGFLNEFSTGGDDGQDPFDAYPCYDCGSTIFLHHTKSCDLAEPDAVRDLPEHPGTQHWTGKIPKGLHPIPGLQEGLAENFADGKTKGRSRPGRVRRAGASCKGSVSDLRARAKKYGGERGRMYHWCANMKSGRKKAAK